MAKATCSVRGCNKSTHARGWCPRHYMRWHKHGDPLANKRYRTGVDGLAFTGTCVVDGCGRAIHLRDWCIGHYDRWVRTRDVQADKPLRRRSRTADVCVAKNCQGSVHARDLCKKHYGDWRTRGMWGDPDRREKQLAYLRKWRNADAARNPEKVRAAYNAWRAKNPDAARLIDHRKRAWRLGVLRIPFTSTQLADRMRYWGNRCWMCGGPFEAVDHVKPLSRGGAHALMNLRPACRACNSAKRDRWPFPVSARIPTAVAA